jgi:ATP-dependent Lon protease
LSEIIYPVLPLRDIVIFPHMIAPLFVGRSKSIKALEYVMEHNKEIILLTQKKSSIEDPNRKDLYTTGTIGTILQLLKLPDGTVKVLVEGKSRCKIDEILTSSSHLTAKVKLINETYKQDENSSHQINRLTECFERFVKLNGKINSDILSTISEITDASILTDTIINHLLLDIREKQYFLEIIEPFKRVEELIVKIDTEISVLDSEKKVRSRVKKTNGKKHNGNII